MADIKTTTAFVKLAEKRDKLKSDLKQIEAQMKDKEQEIMDYLTRQGIQNLKAAGRTLYIRREIYASMRDNQIGVEMLKKHGYGDMDATRPVHQRLSSWVREKLMEVEHDDDMPASSEIDLASKLDLPDELKEQIKVSEKFSLRVRKA